MRDVQSSHDQPREDEEVNAPERDPEEDRRIEGLVMNWRYQLCLRSPLMRRIYEWHLGESGHPVAMRWSDDFLDDSHHGPRNEWVCNFLDWLTGGYMHD